MARRTGAVIHDYTKTLCPTCGCCSIGRMGVCVGGCGPRGGRSKHDRAAREAAPDTILATLKPLTATTTANAGNTASVLSSLSEREFQKIVREGLERRGYMVMVIPDMRKTVAGWPDLTFWHPKRPGAPLYCWELKTEAGKATPKQQATLAHLATVPGIDARIVRPSDWRALSEEV